MKHFVSLLCLFLLAPVCAHSQISITIDLKTSHPTAIRLLQHSSMDDKGHLVWEQPMNSSGIATHKFEPQPLSRYTIRDRDGILPAWLYAENGDSLVIRMDLDSGVSRLTFDKRRNYSRYKLANELYRKYLSRFDSAGLVLEWQPMKQYFKVLHREHEFEAKSLLDSTRGSEFHKLIADGVEYLPIDWMLRRLRNPWDEASKQELANDKILLYSDLMRLRDSKNGSLPIAFNNWLAAVLQQSKARGESRSDDIRMSAINGLPKDLAGEAFLAYARNELIFTASTAYLDRIDSLSKTFSFDQDQAKRYQEMIGRYRAISTGNLAPDFELPDTAGVTRKLSQMRGKLTLVDFWGTWCGPCREELPYVDTLAKQYGDKLQVVGVALESGEVSKWQRFVRSRKLPGIQLYAESQFNNEEIAPYQIQGPPTYMLIGPDGVIIESRAPRPSDPKLRELIDRELRKKD